MISIMASIWIQMLHQWAYSRQSVAHAISNKSRWHHRHSFVSDRHPHHSYQRHSSWLPPQWPRFIHHRHPDSVIETSVWASKTAKIWKTKHLRYTESLAFMIPVFRDNFSYWKWHTQSNETMLKEDNSCNFHLILHTMSSNLHNSSSVCAQHLHCLSFYSISIQLLSDLL